MPSRDWKLRIRDILESVAAVESYVAGMTFEAFEGDQKTIDAIVRRFTVIGEAANHVPAQICLRNPHIPWEDMRAMRNFVVHEYFGVSDRTRVIVKSGVWIIRRRSCLTGPIHEFRP